MSQRYFAIFGAMRTGSNLLEKTLEALGDTVCYGEAFNPAFIGGPLRVDERGWTPATRDADPLTFLSDLVERDDRLTGFRIFKGHNQTALRFALTDPNCARIILTRDPVESYVSLKIARETDQWVLRYPRRRISTRVRFDPEEFANYRDEQATHYAWMDEVMTNAGTDALRIDYSDLGSHEALANVARHIGSSGALPKTAPLLKQNPGPLSQKVENHAEMCVALGLEPEDDPSAKVLSIHSMPQFLAPADGLHAYAPIDGPGFGPGVALVHWLDQADTGSADVATGRVLDAAVRGQLFPPLADEDLARRVVFTFVADPLERAYALLIEELFGPGWKHATVRRLLADRVGPLPEGRGALRRPDAFTATRAQEVLRAFLDIIDAALSGNGSILAPPAWHTQVAQIAAYETRAPVARLIPMDAVPRFIRRQCARIRAPVPTARDIAKMLAADGLPVPGLADVADDDIRARVKRIYAEDYIAFGELISGTMDRPDHTDS